MATYYVDPVSGNDGNAGTSFGAAWKTTQKAADTAVAGDTVYLCETGVESISAKIDIDTNAGSSSAPIRFVGANSSGTVDGTRYTIQAGASVTAILDFTASADYTEWHNIILDGNGVATYGVYNNVDGSDYHQFRRCRVTDCATSNVYVRGSVADGWAFFGCEIDNAGSHGIAHAASNRGYMLLIGTDIHDNGGIGWNVATNNARFAHGQVYRNGSHGIALPALIGGRYSFLTIYGNSGDGLRFDATAGRVPDEVFCVSSVSNTGYGFNTRSQDLDILKIFDYCHTHGNGSGAADVTLPGLYNVIGDPLFTSTTDGSEDFRPASTSPLVGAGLGGRTIGAKEPAASSAAASIFPPFRRVG